MTAMIIVPHQDDELNVAGPQIYELIRNGWSVKIVYTTNGDYLSSSKNAGYRLREAINALKILGINAENIIFLGYGDRWTGEKHLYNSGDKEILKSYFGRTHTYGIKEHEDFSYCETGQHNDYTRAGYKTDLNNVILKYMPELLIVVDFDSHYDHRATSLMFEEVMSEILKRKKTYTPIILKGFAYMGKWEGPKDYYSYPKRYTLPPESTRVLDSRYQLDVPAYGWDKRVRIKTPDELIPALLTKSPLYKAAKCHKSQPAGYFMLRVINADNVFWVRRTDNLMRYATIKASSGNSAFLNDFKYIGCDNVNSDERSVKILNDCVWIPEQEDTKKKVIITFKQKCNLTKITFFENFSLDDNIMDLLVEFDNGFVFHTGELNHFGQESEYVFDKQCDIQQVTIKILAYMGLKPGLTEIEIYENIENNDLEKLPFEYIKMENGNPILSVKKMDWRQRIEKFILDIKYLLTQRWKLKIYG